MRVILGLDSRRKRRRERGKVRKTVLVVSKSRIDARWCDPYFFSYSSSVYPPPPPPGWPIEGERTSSSSPGASLSPFPSLPPCLTDVPHCPAPLLTSYTLTSSNFTSFFPSFSTADLILPPVHQHVYPITVVRLDSGPCPTVAQKVLRHVSSKTILSTTLGNIEGSTASGSREWD